ncbi:dipeptidyl peptidase 1-like [Macrobrachium nipponense]|uniref:dipeptidyl peptidase 1-like n=1 Tax=Macrobrachium nipponense TaxID=159736 RepID=UPI0030C85F99
MLLRGLLLLCCSAVALADLPIHCLYEEVLGTWTFSETDRVNDHTLNCDALGEIVYEKTFILEFPNTVTDELGNFGTWTLMYDEGFEVRINERSYFAYFKYAATADHSVSYCDQTMNGWSHDLTNRNWACFSAQKSSAVPPRTLAIKKTSTQRQGLYKNDPKQIEKINSSQKSWWAKAYPEHEKYTIEDMYKRAGGRPVTRDSFPRPAPITKEQRAKLDFLPEEFDWRNIDGVDYVSPVRDQANCGSCYAFGSMGMLEARLRITSKNQRNDTFSAQDVMTCSTIAQGCDGGFNFLTAGRHTFEQGVVAEECNIYEAIDETCDTDPSCSRTYVSDYEYIGGYYGATNEVEMMHALVNNGPIAVAFMVNGDLVNYGGGIYHNTGIPNEFTPFEETNHAVLAVGYGVDKMTGEKFWTLKNSWGDWWGESGYFRIRRGVDESAIESCSVQSFIIP